MTLFEASAPASLGVDGGLPGATQLEGVAAPGSPTLLIVVHGLPAPQGSKSGFVNPRTGRVQMKESSNKVKPWRQDVVTAALDASEHPAWHDLVPLDGPLAVRMVFTMPKPKSAPKTRRTWPDRMPDLSKLARSTEDALTTAGIWADDARVVQYDRLAKVYPGEDPEALNTIGARIEIRPVTR